MPVDVKNIPHEPFNATIRRIASLARSGLSDGKSAIDSCRAIAALAGQLAERYSRNCDMYRYNHEALGAYIGLSNDGEEPSMLLGDFATWMYDKPKKKKGGR